MSKPRQYIDKRVPTQQTSLLDYIKKAQLQRLAPSKKTPAEGTLNVSQRLCQSLNRSIKACSLSRHQIAGEMSHLLGVEINKTTIDSWTAESKPQNRIPAEYLPAFCKTTGCNEPLEILNDVAGIFAMPGPDALRSEIQKYAEAEKKARQEKRKRELLLQEITKRR